MSSLTITTIQTALHWENPSANLLMFEEKLRSIEEKTEIVLLPEMFSTGFSMRPQHLAETMEGNSVTWMRDMATKYRIVLGGSLMIEEEGKFYNRFVWMLPTGLVGYYDKRHRFAFAGEDQHYTAGEQRKIASVKGWKINLQVCYDLRFPVWARQSVEPTDTTNKTMIAPEYDLLIYVANWPEKRIRAWKILLCARAIENQCYVVGVNRVGNDGNDHYYSGNTMVVDPLGEVLYHMADTEDINTITLLKEPLEAVRAKFPFWKDADTFMINHVGKI